MAPTTQSDTEKPKNFDRGVKDMVSAITDHISGLHKPGSSHQHHEEEDGHGVKIVTLAGTNTGATMRSELQDDKDSSLGDQPEPMNTYVNSNFQAVNNSIMMDSSYSTNDPGVHMEVSDIFEQEHGGRKTERNGKKGKKKDNEAFKSDQHTGHSD
ncbi:hypothetical protein HS088_TW16G00833 [Tripterygium wilfordii]|uniref:Uncharacterized protein n=1 Tax=Tripterygium wilfordii TaxID=458696 RepID=A0A7J7CK13_TRIWF|nr:uncharacterized protein LOC119980770 [Tripterygium wilfordii]KAF5734384.1 hypothetical protein HS088_TW16G00833 [Tripterygium wilfordii]